LVVSSSGRAKRSRRIRRFHRLPGSGEPIWITSYGYDTLGNLISVLQNGSRSRSFSYDSLSRLLTSTNPKSHHHLLLQSDGPVLTKTDARGIVTCSGAWSGSTCNASTGYDALHRPRPFRIRTATQPFRELRRTNCLGLTSCQNVGHRTSMTDAAVPEIWSYQVDAPITKASTKDQRTNTVGSTNITKTATYYLDLAGNVTRPLPHGSHR